MSNSVRIAYITWATQFTVDDAMNDRWHVAQRLRTQVLNRTMSFVEKRVPTEGSNRLTEHELQMRKAVETLCRI